MDTEPDARPLMADICLMIEVVTPELLIHPIKEFFFIVTIVLCIF